MNSTEHSTPNRRSTDREKAQSMASDVLRFAREELGPASERFLADASAQVMVLAAVRRGKALEDAVLGQIFRVARSRPDLSDEFMGFFLRGAMTQGSPQVSDGLRRFLDTGDLVQSVFGNIWEGLEDLTFESRGQFFSLISQRMGWKASDKVRALQRDKRREDMRISRDPASFDGAEEDSTTPDHEERERLILALLRLPERDQRLLRVYLRGGSSKEIGDELGVTPEAARKALQRAMRRAREVYR
ncbi:MAG: sigma-70 family RNA polymerase sigma factor [Planctomycetota bacterium]|nr:sigma-70 family RNA polymerase sigma factor [Planctomycetota bacterium]